MAEVEIWKDVPGYEGHYQVSSLGNLVSHKYKIRTPLKLYSNRGYLRVHLRLNNVRKSFYVHRLVAFVFIGNQHGKSEVNHIDGNRTNNRLSNLEWVTAHENATHRNIFLNSYPRADTHLKSKPVIGTSLVDGSVLEFKCGMDAAKHFGSRHCNLWRCLAGRRKKWKNYTWKYKTVESV